MLEDLRTLSHFVESQRSPWDQCAFDVHEAYTAAMDGFKWNGIENTWMPFLRDDLTDTPETGENMRILREVLDRDSEATAFAVCMKDIVGSVVVQFVADFGEWHKRVVEIESRRGDVSIRSYEQTLSDTSSHDVGIQRAILGHTGADGSQRAERLYSAATAYLDFTIVRAETYLEEEAFNRLVRPEIPLDVMDVQTVWT